MVASAASSTVTAPALRRTTPGRVGPATQVRVLSAPDLRFAGASCPSLIDIDIEDKKVGMCLYLRLCIHFCIENNEYNVLVCFS